MVRTVRHGGPARSAVPSAGASAGADPSGHGSAGGPAAALPLQDRPLVLPRIVPGPSGSAPAGSTLTTPTPTEPLRAGRRSWAAVVGAAIATEAALLWLAVGLTIRRRSHASRRRATPARKGR